MKKIKFTKTGRRFLRTIGVLFAIWVVFSVFYITSWTKFPDRKNDPITIGINDPNYSYQIKNATAQLKGTSERIDVPSFSVAVGHKGAIIWSAAEGYQDVASLAPATPKTQYRVGSTSKSITATGVARQVYSKNLDLDAIIGDTITNWQKKEWDFTMRQLLSHTAGVGNYSDFGIASGKYTLCNCYQFNTASEGLKVFNRYDLLYEPGTSFAYSSFDVNLASVVLEQSAGLPFLEYMKKEVFQPLDMQDTYGDHAQDKTEHFATFYQTEDGYFREFRNFEQVYDINMSYKWAGGGFISTPTDLVKMGNAYLNDSTFLDHKTIREFWTPTRLTNGEINVQEYAIGWRSYLEFKNEHLINDSPIWMVHHGGVSKGSMNFLVIFPEYDLVIDASINARVVPFSDFSKEVYKIADHFLKDIQKEELVLYKEIKKRSE